MKRTSLSNVVAFDPGGTTGYAIFWNGRLAQCGSFETFTLLSELIRPDVSVVVCEGVKARSATFNDVGIRVSGVIEYLCWRTGVKFMQQTPTILEGMYKLVSFEGMNETDVHTTEAILHGIYFLHNAQVVKLPIAVKNLITR